MTDKAGSASERFDRFQTQITGMPMKDEKPSRERLLLSLGTFLMVAGVAIGVGAYAISHGTTNPLQQRDAIVIALIGLTLAVAGAATFVRFGLTQFLRLWLARLIFEQQTQRAHDTNATTWADTTTSRRNS